MSKFIGHVLPGIYVVLLTSWWLYNVFRDFFASIGHRRPIKVSPRANIPTKVSPHNNANQFPHDNTNQLPTFRSRIWYADSLCRRMPLEIAAKVFMPITLIILEYSTPGPTNVHDYHHTTVQLAFTMDGLVDLMVYYKWPLPKYSDTASLVFQIVTQILVFESHQHGKMPFGQALHKYIIWNFSVHVLLVCLQSAFRSNATLALLRVFSYLLFGTWIIQIGFLMEPPISEIDVFHWKTKNEGEQLMILGFLFALHYLVDALIVFVFGAIVYFATKKPIVHLHHNGVSKDAQNDDIEPLLSTNVYINGNDRNVKNGLVPAIG